MSRGGGAVDGACVLEGEGGEEGERGEGAEEGEGTCLLTGESVDKANQWVRGEG
jgi:hypothetical protein